MSPTHTQPSRARFIDAVEKAFGYLVTDFAFRRETPAADSRDVEVAYSNSCTRVVVEGTNWGLNARVALGRSSPTAEFENFDLNDLIALRSATGEAAPPQGTIERGSTQMEQIPYYARMLREVGRDILLGDLNIFPALQAIVDERARTLR